MSRGPLIVALLVLAVALGACGVLGGDGREPAGGATATATVTRVVDGDTVILSDIGRSRLIGVDTPEVRGRRACFGAQASAFAKRILDGRRVRYELGAEKRDRYGRALVYVWLADGRLFNAMLIAGGYARTLEIAPNLRYAERLRARARDARREERGLWSASNCSS